MRRNNLIVTFLLLILSSCNADAQQTKTEKKVTKKNLVDKNMRTETAIVGGGCFWCTEAQYLALDGVEKVQSGYSGGQTKNPTYKEVCTGTTGHAEVIKITYDADKISYADILQAFFVSHDPTTLNRQGADVGTQYRSAIFAESDEQLKTAQDIVKQLNADGVYDDKVVTVVEMLDIFYVAEDYHQNYFAQNGDNQYCQRVVGPKVEKFKKVFKDRLKQ